MERVLQCVAPRGMDSRVRVITRSTSVSIICRGAPGRGSSISPSRRRLVNRVRHFPTVCGVIRRATATAMLDFPVAHVRIMRARWANACAVLRRFTQRSKVSRSSFLKLSGERGRPFLMAILLSPPNISDDYDLFNEFMTQDTSIESREEAISMAYEEGILKRELRAIFSRATAGR